MVCIYCGKPTQVINSRKQQRTSGIWRRRKCLACSAIFTTEEHIRLDGAIMVRDAAGGLTPFVRDQLFASILISLQHRGESAVSDTAGLTDTIVKTIIMNRRPAVDAAALCTEVHRTLKRFDDFAAEHYAMYHHAKTHKL